MMVKVSSLALVLGLVSSVSADKHLDIILNDGRTLHWTEANGKDRPTGAYEYPVLTKSQSFWFKDDIPDDYRDFRIEGAAGHFQCHFVGKLGTDTAYFTFRKGSLCNSSAGVTVVCPGHC